MIKLNAVTKAVADDAIGLAPSAVNTTVETLAAHPSFLVVGGYLLFKYLSEESRGEPLVNGPYGMLNQANFYAHGAVKATVKSTKKLVGHPVKTSEENDTTYTDKTRHETLCKERKKLSEKLRAIDNRQTLPSDIGHPLEWVLDASNRPQYATNFSEHADVIRGLVNNINASDFPQKELVSALVGQIYKLFNSLSHRCNWLDINRTERWQVYRADGFEVMFFSDLAHWFVNTLSGYNVKKAETPKLVKEWIRYCEKIREHVIFRRDPPTYEGPEPVIVLDSIIEDLNILHHQMEKTTKALTFNDRITNIHGHFKSILKNTLELLHSLQENAVYPFSVKDYLTHSADFAAPLQHYNPKNTRIGVKNTNLVNFDIGRSIIALLNRTGIVIDNYEPTKDSIDIDHKETFELCLMPSNGIYLKDHLYLQIHPDHIEYTARDVSVKLAKEYTLREKKPYFPNFKPSDHTFYLTLSKDSFQYEVLDTRGHRQTGKIRYDALPGSLAAPVTLDALKACLPEIMDLTSLQNHTPPIPVKKGNIQLSALAEEFKFPVTLEQLKPHLSAILDITTIRGHTPAEKHLPLNFNMALYTPEEIEHYFKRCGLISAVYEVRTDETKADVHAQAFGYLTQIMELNRLLTKICYVQKFILLSSLVVSDYGRAWLYGEDARSEIASRLLDAVEFSLSSLGKHLRTFWGQFFGENGRVDAKDDSNPLQRQLLRAKHSVQQIEHDIEAVKQEIILLRKELQQEFDIQKMENQLNKLISDVDYYLFKNHPRYMGTNAPSHLLLISGEIQASHTVSAPDTPEQSASTPPVSLAVPMPSVVTPVNNTADGNCFFHAVESELKRLQREAYTYKELREKAIVKLREMQTNGTSSSQFATRDESMDDYIERMSGDSQYAEGPIITALADALKCQLCIMEIADDGTKNVRSINEDSQEIREGIVCLQLQSKHYSPMATKDNNMPLKTTSTPVEEDIVPMPPEPPIDRQVVVEDATKLPFLRKILEILLSKENIPLEAIQKKLKKELSTVSPTSQSDFHSPLHFSLYTDFFEHKQFGKVALDWYFWTFVNQSWWFLPNDQIAPYLNFFYRFKSAMDALFIAGRQKLTTSEWENTPKPTPNEMRLIELVFCHILVEEFHKHKYYPHHFTLPEDTILIKSDKTHLEFMFDTFTLKMARDTINEGFADLIRTSEVKIEQLTEKLGKSEEELKATQSTLKERDSELEKTKDELADTKDELADTKDELADREDKLADTKDKLADTEDKLKRRDAEFTEIKREFDRLKASLARARAQNSMWKNHDPDESPAASNHKPSTENASVTESSFPGMESK